MDISAVCALRTFHIQNDSIIFYMCWYDREKKTFFNALVIICSHRIALCTRLINKCVTLGFCVPVWAYAVEIDECWTIHFIHTSISFHLEYFVFTKFSLCIQIMSYWASLTCSSQSHSFLRIKRKLMESIVWILRNICKKLCHICMVLYLNNSDIPDKNQWFCNQLHNLHRAIVNFIWYIIAHTWN